MNSSSHSSVSVIICTRNRFESLHQTLQSMSMLNLDRCSDFELVVVDNGSTDSTSKIVEEFSRACAFSVIYLWEGGKGLSAARNAGIGKSRGGLIMFTDDDCFPEQDWVDKAIGIFSDALPRIVGGRVELYNSDHLPVSVKTQNERETLVSAGQVFGFLLGANMAFTRTVIDQVGPFDRRLGAGTATYAAEDTEFVYRAFISGLPVTYEPILLIYHNHGRTDPTDGNRLDRGYAFGGGALLMKSLLAKRTDLIRPIYWDICSGLKDWRDGRRNWRWPASKFAFIPGALRYLLEIGFSPRGSSQSGRTQLGRPDSTRLRR